MYFLNRIGEPSNSVLLFLLKKRRGFILQMMDFCDIVISIKNLVLYTKLSEAGIIRRGGNCEQIFRGIYDRRNIYNIWPNGYRSGCCQFCLHNWRYASEPYRCGHHGTKPFWKTDRTRTLGTELGAWVSISVRHYYRQCHRFSKD